MDSIIYKYYTSNKIRKAKWKKFHKGQSTIHDHEFTQDKAEKIRKMKREKE